MRKLSLLDYFFSQNYNWKRNLHYLDECRPKMGRAEYIEILALKGFDRKHIKVAYDQLKVYLSLDEFSMYPQDDIYKYYLRTDIDLSCLLRRICNKIKSNKELSMLENFNHLENITIENILIWIKPQVINQFEICVLENE